MNFQLEEAIRDTRMGKDSLAAFKNCWLVASIITTLASALADQPPPRQIESPNGDSSVELRHTALPGDPFGPYGSTIIVWKHNREIAKASTIGYLLGCLWSPDNQYVAVNNRRGTSGDYLWVFSLHDGKTIRRPEAVAGKNAITERVKGQLPQFARDDVIVETTIAKGWLSPTELRVDTSLLFRSSPGTWFVLSEVYTTKGGRFELKQSGIAKKVPAS